MYTELLDDVIDSRDIDTRIDELEGGFLTSDETEELNFLIKLRDDIDTPRMAIWYSIH